jgi:hypothetical protein
LAAGFLTARGVELEQARREDIEAFIADQLARWKPATAAVAMSASFPDYV